MPSRVRDWKKSLRRSRRLHRHLRRHPLPGHPASTGRHRGGRCASVGGTGLAGGPLPAEGPRPASARRHPHRSSVAHEARGHVTICSEGAGACLDRPPGKQGASSSQRPCPRSSRRHGSGHRWTSPARRRDRHICCGAGRRQPPLGWLQRWLERQRGLASVWESLGQRELGCIRRPRVVNASCVCKGRARKPSRRRLRSLCVTRPARLSRSLTDLHRAPTCPWASVPHCSV